MREMKAGLYVLAEMLHRTVRAGNSHFYAMEAEDGRIMWGVRLNACFTGLWAVKPSEEDVLIKRQ